VEAFNDDVRGSERTMELDSLAHSSNGYDCLSLFLLARIQTLKAILCCETFQT
jgi:hypothetical protein